MSRVTLFYNSTPSACTIPSRILAEIELNLAYCGRIAVLPQSIRDELNRCSGGVLTPFGFESSTLTIVLQQIIALKTMKSKFYVATLCASLISALVMISIFRVKVPYQSCVRIPVWDSLETLVRADCKSCSHAWSSITWI